MNLVLEVDGGGARLFTNGNPGSHPAQGPFARFRAEGQSDATRTPFDCLVESLDGGRIAIRVGNHYLSADDDGMVRINRPWCRTLERYDLVRTDVLDALLLLRRYSWLSHGDRSIVTLAAEAIDFRQHLAFGPARGVRLTGTDAPFIFGSRESQHFGSPMRLHIVASSGVIHTFSRFNPLVYYSLFGHQSFYQCLQISLRSLVEHGGFRGALGVVCDRSPDELMDCIPEALRERLVMSAAAGDRTLFDRYDVDHGYYDEHQPILYCDVDVVFDADITDLLIDVTLRGQVCCATEARTVPELVDLPPSRWNHPSAGYFGHYLYKSDPQFRDRPVALGNSGIIGFDNTGRIRGINDLVRTVARRQSPERLAMFGDQPILDYVLHKTGMGDFQVLDRYCRLTRSTEDVPPSGRRGIVHFFLNSGTGDASEKAALMSAYLAQLEQQLEESGQTSAMLGEAS